VSASILPAAISVLSSASVTVTVDREHGAATVAAAASLPSSVIIFYSSLVAFGMTFVVGGCP